jgi:integrase/recombinase XerC
MMLLNQARTKFINYLKEKNRADATLIAYSKDIEQILDFVQKNGKSYIEEVRTVDLEGFIKYLGENNYTKKTISRKINAMKTFFKFLLDEKIIGEDSATGVQHPKIQQSAPRILSKIEYRALRDTVKTDIRTKAIVEVLLQTGLKINELASMKIESIRFPQNPSEQGILLVPGTQTTPDREIPLNKAVQDALKDYLEIRTKSEYENVFTTKTGKPLLIRNIRATLDRYFKQIGLNDVTINDLRHTFIAEHLRKGASVLLVSKIAGHKRLSTTENYLKYIERQEDAVGTLEEL